jgi:RNA 3'-terminal phosphate cyclase-like protein
MRRIQFLRDLKDFFGVTMKVRPLADLPSNAEKPEDLPEEAYVLSCVGIGYSNIAKKT